MKKKPSENNAFFEFILSNINDAVFLTETDGTFLYVCPNVDVIFGYNAQEVEQLGNLSNLIGEYAVSIEGFQPPCDLQNIEWNVSDKHATDHTVLANIRSVDFDGRLAILYVLRDITHDRHLETELRACQKIVSTTDDLIALVDRNYRYRIVNNTYSRLTQRSPDQIIGRTVADLLGGDVFRGVLKKKLDLCFSGEKIRYQAWFDYPQTGRRLMDVTYTPFREGAIIAGAAVNGRDITDLKQQELALGDSHREVEMRSEISKLFLISAQGPLFNDVLTLLRRKFDSQYGYIGYIDNSGDLVCPSMTEDIWPQCRMPEKRWVFPRDCWGGIWGESLAHRASVLRNENLNPPEGHLPLENALVVPLMVNQKLIGQIALANKPQGYQREDQHRLESIAEFMAPILKIYLEKKSAQKDLELHASKLDERNTALKVLLENRNDERRKLGDMILENFEKLVFPYFERLANCQKKEDIQTLLDIVESNTHDCLTPLETSAPKRHRLLTPMEIQVADLIKAGKTSKEISGILNISPRTVYFHRNSIRKKFNLQNTKTNLRSVLNT